MNKSDAINLLGGTPTKAAAAIGCKPQAVSQWPDPLTPRIRDRVEAAIARLKKPTTRVPKSSHESQINKTAN
jgi:hypothetical protein